MKVVLTGGPCVGKSTLIRKLEERGFYVLPEFATEVINDGGPNPCEDHEAFQHEVLRRQLTAEAHASGVGLLFLDRGAYDGIPYREIYGRRVPDFFAALQPGLYDVCFLLDRLPWVDDGVRYEDPDFARDIDPNFARVYENNDVPVVRVPVTDPESRLQFILERVESGLRKRLKTTKPRASGLVAVSANDNERTERRCFSLPFPGASTSFAPSLSPASAG
jgi:predicted ATPase